MHRRLVNPAGVLALTLALMCSVSLPARGQDVTDEQVGKTIEAMKKYLFSRVDPTTGGWDITVPHKEGYNSGVTALVTYAMLSAGESPQRPEIARALQVIQLAEEAPKSKKGTYQIGLHAHIWAYLPDSYLPMLQSSRAWLLEAASKNASTYGYQISAGGGDHSCTQYGLLGMWEASKRGLRAESKYWENALDHWVASQNTDGGWEYRNPTGASTGSMSAAGLTSLLVAQQELFRANPKADPRITASIQRGLNWFDRNFSATNNPGRGGDVYYYLYGVERVALASGVKDFRGKDWFAEGAKSIIRAVNPSTGAVGSGEGSVINTAFGMAFLARGRVPVWVSKLQIPGLAWNNRPNDLYFLNQYLSAYREGEVNWQVIDIARPAEDMRSAPILYIASDQPLSFSDEQVQNLRRYLDLGGLLWVNPDSMGREPTAPFVQSVRELLDRMYPKAKLTPVPESHPLFTVQHKIANPGSHGLLHYHNGVRDVILCSTKDWGLAFQSEEGAKRSNVWLVAANLFVLATDRGVLENRLTKRFETRADRGKTADFPLGQARYNGNWLPEPLAHEPLATRVWNVAGLDLKPQPIDLASIGSSDLRLITLHGTDKLALNDAQKQAIQQYVQNGGTLLIENVGGRSAFSVDLEKQLRATLGAFTPLDRKDPIITGQGLEGGANCSVVAYRRFTVWNSPRFGPQPRFTAHYLNGRPAVIVSHDDLSLGVLDVRHWGISGYAPDAARHLMSNLVLRVHATPKTPASAPADAAPPAAAPADAG